MRGFVFTQTHSGKWWICEHAVGNQPIARAALPSGEIILNDVKVIDGTHA